MVGSFGGVQFKGAGFLAFAALDTSILVQPIAENGYRIETAVNSTQRAQITAEGAIIKQGKNDDTNK